MTKFEFSCTKLIDGKVAKADEPELIAVYKIVVIDTISITKNDRRLRLRTLSGEYVLNFQVATSIMEDMLSKFGFWRSDTSTIVNMNYAEKVVEGFFAAEVVFKDADIAGEIAKSKIRVLKQLFPHIPVVRAG